MLIFKLNHKISHFPFHSATLIALFSRWKNFPSMQYFSGILVTHIHRDADDAMCHARLFMLLLLPLSLSCSAIPRSIIDSFYSLKPWWENHFHEVFIVPSMSQNVRAGVKKECQFYCLHTLVHLLARSGDWLMEGGGCDANRKYWKEQLEWIIDEIRNLIKSRGYAITFHPTFMAERKKSLNLRR